MRPSLRWITRLSAFVLLMGGFTALAGADEFRLVSVGFGGAGKVGRALPIRVVVDGSAESLHVSVVDPRGDRCVHVFTGEAGEFAGEVLIGRLEGELIFQTVDAEGEVTAEHRITHGEKLRKSLIAADEDELQKTLRLFRMDVPFLVSVGRSSGVEKLLTNVNKRTSDSPLLTGTIIATPESLPSRVAGFDSVDVLFLNEDFSFNDAQAAAIRRWTVEGGRLLISVGQNVGDFHSTTLGQWIQSYFGLKAEPSTIRRMRDLQRFVPDSVQIVLRQSTEPVAVMSDPRNEMQVSSTAGPLVATQSLGGGQVSVVAFDVNSEVFESWASLPWMYEVLIFGAKLSGTTDRETRSARISQSGVTDVGTQLLTSIDAEPSDGQWSTWSVMAMLIAWLVLIGPVDYYLVSRILKRPHLTWITLPLLIAGAVWATSQFSENSDADVNREVHVVDVVPDNDIQHVTARSWLSLAREETQRVELQASVKPGFMSEPADVGLAWSGRPEDIFGGLYRVQGIGFGQQDYTFDQSDRSSVSSFPLRARGSRHLQATWRATPEKHLVNASLKASRNGRLQGTISHSFPLPITDYVLAYSTLAYRSINAASEIAPNTDWDPNAEGVLTTNLKAFLNGERIARDNSRKSVDKTFKQNTPYDPKSTDASYIVRMASLYDAAGGKDYVGLNQNLLSHLEVSDIIRNNHAVLIGRVDAAATSLSVNGQALESDQAEAVTIVRLVLPVAPYKPTGTNDD